MKIIVYSYGKIKNKHIYELEQNYLEKIKRFISIESIEIKEAKNFSLLPVNVQRKITEKTFLQIITPDSLCVLLDSKGNLYDSETFASVLKSWLNFNKKKLIFLIAGPYGLTEDFKKNFVLLSLSKLTFTHELTRIILLEQLYRAFTILNNISYHY